MKISEVIKVIKYVGWCERETVDYNGREFEHVVQQIYNDNVKARKWDELGLQIEPSEIRKGYIMGRMG